MKQIEPSRVVVTPQSEPTPAVVHEVIKRDGRIEQFDLNKILVAATKCYQAINKMLPESVQEAITKRFSNPARTQHLEDIQDALYKIIRKDSRAAGKEFKRYREQRNQIRDMYINGTYYDSVLSIVNGEQETEVFRENANKDATTLSTMRDLIAGETCKKIYRQLILDPVIMDLHDRHVIHFHDMDYRLMKGITNCCLTNMEDMLDNGTVMNGKKIRSPHSLRTAATVATQIILGITGSQYGGISWNISALSPYLRKSKARYEEFVDRFDSISEGDKSLMVNQMVAKELHDSIQTVLYQLNSMNTTNGQSPFVTIFCYEKGRKGYEKETAMLIEELFKQRLAGMESPDGHNINPAFPKIVYTLTEENIKPGHKLTQLAAECSSKRMVPDYISEKKMKEYKEGNCFSVMGCRSCLSVWKDENGVPKFNGRGNIAVISINIPYLALESQTWEEFLKKLEDMVDLISAQQKKVYDSIAATKVDVAPLMWCHGGISRAKPGTLIGDIIKDRYFTASIGYMGVAEAVYRFGVEYVSDKGHEMGLEIMKTLYERTEYNKEKYNLGLAVYGTPAESLTDKFAKALKEFPIIPHVNDRPYITNSYHIPVEYKTDEFSKFKFESEFQKYSTGGAISYVELGDVSKNPQAVWDTLRAIYDYMMYAEINTKSCGICYSCGHEGALILHKDGTCECPACGEKRSDKLYYVLRMCGYLGAISNRPNEGRMGDLMGRVDHCNIDLNLD